VTSWLEKMRTAFFYRVSLCFAHACSLSIFFPLVIKPCSHKRSMCTSEMLNKPEGGRLSSGLRVQLQELGCSGPSHRDLQAQMVMLIFLDHIHLWNKAQALCKLLQERRNSQD